MFYIIIIALTIAWVLWINDRESQKPENERAPLTGWMTWLKYFGLDAVAATSATAGAVVDLSEVAADNYRENSEQYDRSTISKVEFKDHSEVYFTKGKEFRTSISKTTKASEHGIG